MSKHLALFKSNGELVVPELLVNNSLQTVGDIKRQLGNTALDMDEYNLALILENEQKISELGISGSKVEIRYDGTLELPRKRKLAGCAGTSGGSQQPTEDVQAQATDSLVWLSKELLPLYKPMYDKIVSLPQKMKIKVISRYCTASSRMFGIEYEVNPRDSVSRIKKELKSSNKLPLPPLFTLWHMIDRTRLDENMSLRGNNVKNGEVIAICEQKTWSLRVRLPGAVEDHIIEVDPLLDVSELKRILNEATNLPVALPAGYILMGPLWELGTIGSVVSEDDLISVVERV